MIAWLKRLWRGGDGKYTVISDYSRFRPQDENVEHIIGIRAARRFARRWVKRHPFGQAKIFKGHIN